MYPAIKSPADSPTGRQSQRTLPGSEQPLVVSGSHVINCPVVAQSCDLSAAVNDSALGTAGKALIRPSAAAWAVLSWEGRCAAGGEKWFLWLDWRTEGWWISLWMQGCTDGKASPCRGGHVFMEVRIGSEHRGRARCWMYRCVGTTALWRSKFCCLLVLWCVFMQRTSSGLLFACWGCRHESGLESSKSRAGESVVGHCSGER